MAAQMQGIRSAVSAVLAQKPPDLVLVQGDTNSALAAAQAAHRFNIPIGHVEAGLRSFNMASPWPEEPNRVEIARLATLHFAPSPAAVANLKQEAVSGHVLMTGNPGIDALLSAKPIPSRFARPTILVTCHRRENFGPALAGIASAIASIAKSGEADVVMPLHPNRHVRDYFDAALSGIPNVRLIAPLGYRAMIGALRAACAVLTDSGGLQEECAALGVPLLLMRAETERPEVVANGNCRLVGSDPATIFDSAMRLLRDPGLYATMSTPAWPYGRGNAARRIVAAIVLHFGGICTMGPHHDAEMDTRQLAGPQWPPDAQLPGHASA